MSFIKPARKIIEISTIAFFVLAYIFIFIMSYKVFVYYGGLFGLLVAAICLSIGIIILTTVALNAYSDMKHLWGFFRKDNDTDEWKPKTITSYKGDF